MTNSHLITLLHADAAVALGQLGDPRPGVDVMNSLPDLAWSDVIDPGPFIMGDESSLYTDSKPQFTCNHIIHPYRISRYPVTVAQYSTFIYAGGYNKRHYWTKAGWQWRQKHEIIAPQHDFPALQVANHPQVGVSWYEAVAFCNWLAEQMQKLIRLPTEAEWERASRHTDGRNYPWGDLFDVTCCNAFDTGIGRTVSVGLFPKGDAVCGASDMSGNVWEWCSTQWVDTYYNYIVVSEDAEGEAFRVLRGGSFENVSHHVRSTCRDGFYPYLRSHYLGFRVVLPS